MTLEAVLGMIEADGEQRIHQLKIDSEQRVQSILNEAKTLAEKLKRDQISKREKEAHIESARILQHARHEALVIQQQVHSQITDAALEAILEQLPGLRKRADHIDVLKHLIIEAYELLSPSLENGERPCIEADSRDAALIRSLLVSPEFLRRIRSATVEYTLDCAGGIKLKNADGTIVVQNTLENRLEQAIPQIQRYLASLFEKQMVSELSV